MECQLQRIEMALKSTSKYVDATDTDVSLLSPPQRSPAPATIEEFITKGQEKGKNNSMSKQE